MVLRPEALRQRLLKLEEVVSRLEELERRKKSEDFRDEWAVERGLQLGAEILLDLGNHILSAHFGVTAEDYEDILRQLTSRAVLPTELGERLKGLGGFRNILVHDYLRIDPARVAEFEKRAPRDFRAFARAVREWLSRIENSSGS